MSRMLEVRPKAGVVKGQTELSARPKWFDSQLARFYQGNPRKLGGWAAHVDATMAKLSFTGKCRGLLGWQDNSDVARLALGTHLKVQIEEGAALTNITPIRSTGTLAADPFTTVSGSPVVAVVHTAHGAILGDTVNYSGATAVGGITIDGDYVIEEITGSGGYKIRHSSDASSSATGGGASVVFTYEINIGLEHGGKGLGYGVGFRARTRIGMYGVDYALARGDKPLNGKIHITVTQEF